MTAIWIIDTMAAAMHAETAGALPADVNGISIDSRTLGKGDAFFAIKGENRDGHDYVDNALKGGAGLAVVARDQRDRFAGAPLLIVSDVLEALRDLARAARARMHGRVIAVTGSVGKTGTKEALRLALSTDGETHASIASYNNHWGVPLSLARCPASVKYAIFEIGMNHAGEITPLVGMVRPDIAIITTIAASHLGHFKSLDDIAEAKAEIFSGVVAGGAAIINQDSPYYEALKSRATRHGIKNIIGFGKHEQAAVRLKHVALHPTCSCISADVLGDEVTFKLGVPGAHMALNSLAVLAAVKLAGADLALACMALADAAPAKGRGGQQLLQTPHGDILLIDESYNANPESMAAALNLLSTVSKSRKGRKVAVLGDMLELGQFSQDMHKGLAKLLDEAGIDLLYSAGPMMRHLWDAIPQSRRGLHAETSSGLVEALITALKAGDSVVIKGSFGSKMGLVVEALRQRFPASKKEI